MITGTQIGQVAVDSGQIMIIDPCYINKDFCNEFDGTYEDKQRGSYEMNYNGCCEATLNEKGYGAIGNEYVDALAIASRTTYGDGVYPVYAEFNDNGQITSLTINFDPREEENLCGSCGEDLDWDCRCDEEEEEV
jgi:hypothetical protein